MIKKTRKCSSYLLFRKLIITIIIFHSDLQQQINSSTRALQTCYRHQSRDHAGFYTSEIKNSHIEKEK